MTHELQINSQGKINEKWSLNYFLNRNFPFHLCCYNFLFCSDLLREKEVMGKTARKYLNELKVVFNTQKSTGQGMAFMPSRLKR